MSMNKLMKVGAAMFAPPMVGVFGIAVFVCVKGALAGGDVPPEGYALMPLMVLCFALIVPGFIVFGIGSVRD